MNCLIRILILHTFILTFGWLTDLYGNTGFRIVSLEPARIITPNGDRINDSFIVNFENPKDSSISGKIFDVTGRDIGEMKLSSNGTAIIWDGMDRSGNIAVTGSYIYQIRGEQSVINGIVIVAK